jgi:hypothetical protein
MTKAKTFRTPSSRFTSPHFPWFSALAIDVSNGPQSSWHKPDPACMLIDCLFPSARDRQPHDRRHRRESSKCHSSPCLNRFQRHTRWQPSHIPSSRGRTAEQITFLIHGDLDDMMSNFRQESDTKNVKLSSSKTLDSKSSPTASSSLRRKRGSQTDGFTRVLALLSLILT